MSALPADTVRVRAGEDIAEVIRPHWVSVFLRRPGAWVVTLALSAGVAIAFDRPLAFGGAALMLVYETLEWWSRRYTLTERRVLSEGGVLRRSVADIRLDRVQHAALDQTLVERVLNLGTLGFASSGTGAYEVVWRFVERPDDVMARVRDRLDLAASDREAA
ncbi:MAG: PH domain-containing protein [Planctomycetota bacterium]